LPEDVHVPNRELATLSSALFRPERGKAGVMESPARVLEGKLGR